MFENGPAGLQPIHAIYTAVSSFIDSPGRVAYDGVNGKVYFAQLGSGVVTRLQY